MNLIKTLFFLERYFKKCTYFGIKSYNEKKVIILTPIFNFFVLDIDERCLEKVFNKKKENGQPFATETDITVALAEHLLKKLAPGGSYKVDTDSKLKRSCLCECGGKPTFSPTGMGMITILIFII